MSRQLRFWCVCLLLLAGCSPIPGRRLVIEQHQLIAAPDLSTDNLVFQFAGDDQDQVLARTQAYRDVHQQIGEYNARVLAPLGYRLSGYRNSDHTYSQIFRGDELVADDVVSMEPVSVSTSGHDFIGLVDRADGQYQFTPRGLEKRGFPPNRLQYAYVGDRLLSVQVSGPALDSLLQVYLDEELVYQSSFHNVSTHGSFDGPWSYDGHWALVLLDASPDGAGGWQMLERVVQDGRDLNAVNHYEHSFQFAVLDGQPFFFYQRSGKVGISFGGHDLAAPYDEVPHYQCCSGSLLNPGTSLNAVWFFARQGADWYYVEAYVPTASAP